MKRKLIKPIAVMTLATFTMFGCASSEEQTGSTAMDATTMDDTATMGGSDTKGIETLVVEEQVVVPVATLSVTTLAMENTVELDKMFEDISNTEAHDVVSLASKNPNLSTFMKLVEHANLMDDLQRQEKLTIFAPTNEAFAKIPREKLETLLAPENTAVLSNMLQMHILPSEVSSIQLEDNTRIRISDDSFIPINTTMGETSPRVGGARIVMNDVEASNGRIHVIDSVILPSQDVRDDNTIR